MGRPDAAATRHGDLGGAVHPADHVIAHMHHGGGPLLDGEHGVEAGHAEQLRGRNAQAARDVIQAPGTDPAGAGVKRMQRGQDQTSTFGVATGLPGHPRGAVGRRGIIGTPDGIDSVALVVRRLVGREVKVHQACVLCNPSGNGSA